MPDVTIPAALVAEVEEHGAVLSFGPSVTQPGWALVLLSPAPAGLPLAARNRQPQVAFDDLAGQVATQRAAAVVASADLTDEPKAA